MFEVRCIPFQIDRFRSDSVGRMVIVGSWPAYLDVRCCAVVSHSYAVVLYQKIWNGIASSTRTWMWRTIWAGSSDGRVIDLLALELVAFGPEIAPSVSEIMGPQFRHP